MRIGILGQGFLYWGGGLDFLRMLCGSIHAADEGVEMHLLLPIAGPRLRVRRLAGSAWRATKRSLGRPTPSVKETDSRIIEDFVLASKPFLTSHKIDIGQRTLADACRRLGLHVLLPSMRALDRTDLPPWIGYIPDFQHVHLPQYFSQAEVDARNRTFGELARTARFIIVNAETVADDLRRFAPECQAKIVALPFSAAPDPAWFELPPLERSIYGIGGPYFMISNQFWKHKDHATAYRAFANVLARFPDVQLVCTGATQDYRNPTHFDELCALARSLGIAGQLRVLGLIPKVDQISLLGSSLALIQPTLFEGGPGGGAVYDAVALGVPAIVSDIPVNREVRERDVIYFRSGDVENLSHCMLDLLSHPFPQRASRETLLVAGTARRQRAGRVLLEAVDQINSGLRSS
jgi:glycosyltransferase involved in cell wall biosynthesis